MLCLSPLSAEALEVLRLEFYLKLGRSMHVEVLVSFRWELGLVALHLTIFRAHSMANIVMSIAGFS